MRKDLEQKFAIRWPEWFRDLVAAAEQESFHICEVCGQPGYLIGHNRPRCDEHFHSGSSVGWDERYQKTMTAAGG
jgi:hypothetical protein